MDALSLQQQGQQQINEWRMMVFVSIPLCKEKMGWQGEHESGQAIMHTEYCFGGRSLHEIAMKKMAEGHRHRVPPPPYSLLVWLIVWWCKPGESPTPCKQDCNNRNSNI